jgi:3-oxoacyl-[acyl-carrier-protein] synthase III
MGNSYISGTGKYIPSNLILNEDLENILLYDYDCNSKKIIDPLKPVEEQATICKSEWIKLKMGAKQRYHADKDEYPAEIGAKATLNAINDANITPKEINGIYLGTVGSKYIFPSSAILIQEIIGANNLTDIPIDISAACCGFTKGIIDASRAIKENKAGNYLVIGAETLSKHLYPDSKTYPLFGDGAGAVIISYNDSFQKKGIMEYIMGSNPFNENWKLIMSSKDKKVLMPNGPKVFKYAVANMTQGIEKIINMLDWKKNEILIIPHQANINIINSVKKKLEVSDEQVYINIEKYANTSAASCAIALDEAKKDGTINNFKKVIISSFGSGFVYNTIGIQF